MSGPSHSLKRPAQDPPDSDPVARRTRLQTSSEQPVQSDPDRFSSLPDEIILQILSHLDVGDVRRRVSAVNHRFRKLSLSPEFWKDVVLPGPWKMDAAAAARVLDRCSLLKRLTVRKRTDFACVAIQALRQCPRLEELELEWQTDMSMDALLRAIGESGSALRRLRTSSRWRCAELVDNVKCLRNLTHVELEGFRLSDDGLRAIGDNCGKLEVFDYRYDTLRNRLDWPGLSDDAMNHFLDRVKGTLKFLHFEGNYLSDSSLENIALCQLLQSVKIYSARKMWRFGLEAILNLPNLKKLFIRRANRFRPVDYVAAFASPNLRNLTKISLQECLNLDDQAVKCIAEKCPNLTHLERIFTDQPIPPREVITDECLMFIADHCPNLESFVSQDACSRLSAEAIDYFLARRCKTIRCFVVEGDRCYRSETGNHGSVANIANCHLLQKIGIGCTSPYSLQMMSNLPNLDTLHLAKCHQLSGSDFAKAFQKLKRLACLNLKGCYDVDGEALEAIAKNCKELKHLVLSFCQGYPMRGVLDAILRKCSKLTRLEMRGVDVHQTALETFQHYVARVEDGIYVLEPNRT